MDSTILSSALKPLDEKQIELRLRRCSRLPSLSSVNSALQELLNADQRYTTQVAEVIRRDPSLTARLLRLVNSVYYGFTSKVNNIEEAVFYLGVRQIRQLAMVTPIIEDFQRLAGKVPFRWREFWQHCIGTAMLTREVIGAIRSPQDEVDYVAGLVHDVGKIVMSAAFPEHFGQIYRAVQGDRTQDLLAVEKEMLGLDHCELGALYLKQHNLPDVMVETAACHHDPDRAEVHAQVVAAVHIADLVVRHARIGASGSPKEVTEEDWVESEGWNILLPKAAAEEKAIAIANLRRSLERLPSVLDVLV